MVEFIKEMAEYPISNQEEEKSSFLVQDGPTDFF